MTFLSLNRTRFSFSFMKQKPQINLNNFKSLKIKIEKMSKRNKSRVNNDFQRLTLQLQNNLSCRIKSFIDFMDI